MRGDFVNAITQFENVLEVAPNEGYTLNAMGGIYRTQGKWDLARQFFERSYRLWANCFTSSNLGLVLFYEGSF